MKPCAICRGKGWSGCFDRSLCESFSKADSEENRLFLLLLLVRAVIFEREKIMRQVYLDHSATTPLDPRVLEAMQPYFTRHFGNASSIHAFGQEARAALEESRETIAQFIGAKMDEVFFTSGGTESDNYAIKGVAFAKAKAGKNHVLVSAIEHHAVLEPAEYLKHYGFEVELLPVDRTGMVDPDDVRRAIRPETALISLMHANNEVGTIEPIQEIGHITREHGIAFHSDTVQTVGKISVNVKELNIDLLAISAHKIYGPKGIGAIYIRKGTVVEPLILGGGQESKRRAGTENVPLAVGFAKAVALCEELMDSDAKRIQQLRKKLRDRITTEFEGVIFNGHPIGCLPNILNISFDSAQVELDADTLIWAMDLRGVAVASGSACTSGAVEPSHVLTAMGRDEKTARATIRFSLGRGTTDEDIDYAVDALHHATEKMKRVVSA